MGIVAKFDDKTYGIKWFAERLRMIPSGRHPQINDLDIIKTGFEYYYFTIFSNS